MTTDEPIAVPEFPQSDETIYSQRLPFNQETIELAQRQAKELLSAIPELEGVAIITSFAVPQDRLPFGVILGRKGALRTPAEVMHMSTQMHGAMKFLLDRLLDVLRDVDKIMGERQQVLKQLETQISERQKELARLGKAGTG